MKNLIKNCQWKCNKQQLLWFARNNLNKIPWYLFLIFLWIYRHQINIQPFSIFFIQLTN